MTNEQLAALLRALVDQLTRAEEEITEKLPESLLTTTEVTYGGFGKKELVVAEVLEPLRAVMSTVDNMIDVLG